MKSTQFFVRIFGACPLRLLYVLFQQNLYRTCPFKKASAKVSFFYHSHKFYIYSFAISGIKRNFEPLFVAKS